MDENLLFLGAKPEPKPAKKKPGADQKGNGSAIETITTLEEFWLIAEGSLEYLFAEGGLPS